MFYKCWLKRSGVSRQDLTESNRHKQTARKEREQAQVQPLCPVRPVKKSKVSVPVSPWFCLLSALPLVVRFGRSAAQILQNGPRQLCQLGCAPCSPSGDPFCPLSGPNPPKRTSPASSAWLLLALPLVRFGCSAAQILQNGPCQLGLLGCAPCSPSSGPFWPLSSPNPPKRTSPAWSAWLCSLLSLWSSVLAAQQPKSFKTDVPNSSAGCGCRGGRTFNLQVKGLALCRLS